MAILVFDIGGTAVKYGLYQAGALQGTHSFPTPSTWEKMKADLYSIYQEYSQEEIKGIALSSPGSVDVDQGVIHGISAVPYIHEFPIVEELEALFALPVTIENDANCAALAELAFGVARQAQNVLFFVIGSGIGGAVVINRTLHKGRNLFGGEFGYMMMGDHRTLSQSASPVHVAKDFSKQENLSLALTGKELFERAEGGDQQAQQALEGLYDALARGIFNASLVLNPDLVVLGGGISRRSDLVTRVQEKISILKEETEARELEVNLQVCQYFNDANLLGAVAHFQQKIGDK